MQTMDDQPIESSFFGEGKWLTEFITVDNLEVVALYEEITKGLNYADEKVEACQKWVGSLEYQKFLQGVLTINGRVSRQNDLWCDPSTVIRIGVGNCANKSFLLTSLLRNTLTSDQVFCVLGNLHNGTVGGIDWEVNGQLVGIESADTNEILDSEEDFNTNILNPLKDALGASELSDRNIWGIVLGYKVPCGYTYIDEYVGEHTISATSRISRINNDFELKLPNRLYNRQVFKRFDQDDADFALICSRIDAPTLLQAKEFVDNAEELRRQLFVGGTFYIDPYSDQIGSDADDYKELLENFRNLSLPKLNLDSFSTQFLDPYIDVTIPFVQDDSFV